MGVASTLKLVDQALTGTRGAAGGHCGALSSERARYLGGVGISMRILNNGQSKSFGCDNGTLGTGVPKIREFTHPSVNGSVLVMHSDGIKTHWKQGDYPGLVAGLLYRDIEENATMLP